MTEDGYCSYCAQAYAYATAVKGFDENFNPITASPSNIPFGLGVQGTKVKNPHIVPEPIGTAAGNALTDALNLPFNAGVAANKSIDKGLSDTQKNVSHWWDSITKGLFHGIPVIALIAGGLILLVVLMHR